MKCVYCDARTEGEEICDNCRKWLESKTDPNKSAGFCFDGGTLTYGDIRYDLKCSSADAYMILFKWGFTNGHWRGISLREYRYRKLNGDIKRLLDSVKRKNRDRRLVTAAAMLESNGFVVTPREDNDAITGD